MTEILLAELGRFPLQVYFWLHHRTLALAPDQGVTLCQTCIA